MRLSGALSILFAVSAAAQSADEHGASVGPVQIAYLTKPVEVSISFDPLSGDGALRTVMAQQNEARANSGAAPVKVITTGRSALTGKETRSEQILPPLTSTPRVEFETWAEQLPRDYAEGFLAGFSGIEWGTNEATIHRFVRDNLRHVYVRYSITVEMLPATGTYRATFGNFNGPSPADIPISADWKVISPAQYPVPQIFEDGDALALQLYMDNQTAERLVDYIHFIYQAPLHLRKEPARDSYSDDAEFTISQARLRANGIAQQPAAVPEMLHGPMLSVYIPGHGRFVLSFKPHPELNLEKAGEVSGNLLIFTSKGNLFRIDCAERIATAGSATYKLYGIQDRAAGPPADPGRFSIGLATVEP
jgi:hypothetical protein